MTHNRPTTWPLPFALVKHRETGIRPQGCVVERSNTAVIAQRLGPRAQRYAGLRLTFGQNQIVFWSTESVDLPWLPIPVVYLQPPKNRMFLPIGWRLTVPDRMLQGILEQLPLNSQPGSPLVLLPQSANASSSSPSVIALTGSLSVAAVDWALLARGAT